MRSQQERQLVLSIMLILLSLLPIAYADLFSDVLSSLGISGSPPAADTTQKTVGQVSSSSGPSPTNHAKDMLGMKYKEPTEVPEGD